MNLTLKVYKNGKLVDRVRTHSKRQFTTHLRTINWQNSPLRVYIRVSYGKNKCIKGCLCTFYNDGWYEDEKELLKAVKAFMEED